jgi:flagellar secretion chaperone FliS
MQPPRPGAAYLEASLENAPPIKIIRMLYQGALRRIEQARSARESGDEPSFTDGLHRADAIVSELRMSLDHQVAPELSAQLEKLYLFAEERLATALGSREVEPALEAKQVLERLLDAWQNIELDGKAA